VNAFKQEPRSTQTELEVLPRDPRSARTDSPNHRTLEVLLQEKSHDRARIFVNKVALANATMLLIEMLNYKPLFPHSCHQTPSRKAQFSGTCLPQIADPPRFGMESQASLELLRPHPTPISPTVRFGSAGGGCRARCALAEDPFCCNQFDMVTVVDSAATIARCHLALSGEKLLALLKTTALSTTMS